MLGGPKRNGRTSNHPILRCYPSVREGIVLQGFFLIQTSSGPMNFLFCPRKIKLGGRCRLHGSFLQLVRLLHEATNTSEDGWRFGSLRFLGGIELIITTLLPTCFCNKTQEMHPWKRKRSCKHQTFQGSKLVVSGASLVRLPNARKITPQTREG